MFYPELFLQIYNNSRKEVLSIIRKQFLRRSIDVIDFFVQKLYGRFVIYILYGFSYQLAGCYINYGYNEFRPRDCFQQRPNDVNYLPFKRVDIIDLVSQNLQKFQVPRALVLRKLAFRALSIEPVNVLLYVQLLRSSFDNTYYYRKLKITIVSIHLLDKILSLNRLQIQSSSFIVR